MSFENIISKLEFDTYLLYRYLSSKTESVEIYILTVYRIYSINRPGRLLNFWTLRVGAYSRWALIRGWALINFFCL